MKKIYHLAVIAFFGVSVLACTKQETKETTGTTTTESGTSGSGDLQARVNELEAELKKFREEKALTEMRLQRFDSLDFEFYNKQNWEGFKISHADNIQVIYPDGKETKGTYPAHIDMLTPMFAFAPDTKIRKHPVSFGSGDWTCVVGEMDGTFSKPMKMPNGKVIQPTNKKFMLRMCTVGHWKDGKMTEEYLFWDNAALMQQIGLGQ